MKATFFRIPTEDKLILQGLLSQPDVPTDKAVLHIHGMGGNFYENSFLDTMAHTFTDNGWAFFAINTRGHDYIADIPTVDGSFKRIGDAYEIFEECVYDIKAAIDLLTQQGYRTVALQGHSLGAPKVAYYLAQTQDTRVAKLVFASPADMVGLAEATPGFANLMQRAEQLVREGNGREFLPERIWSEEGYEGYILSAATYVNLSKRDNPVDVFNTYDTAKPSTLATIQVPILAFYGSEDDAAILPLAEALDVMKAKATHCPRFDTAIIPDAPHSYAGHEDAVAQTVVTWLNR